MNNDKIKALLDTCYVAKRVLENMVTLPQGIKPRHINVIDAVFEIGKTNDVVKVSDVSKRLKITMPSVTKLINELCEMKLVKKEQQLEDKRVVTLKLSEKGIEYQKYYVEKYHGLWMNKIKDLTDEDVDTTIRVINRLMETIPTKGELDE